MTGSKVLDDLIREIEEASRWDRTRWAALRFVGRCKRAPRDAKWSLIFAKQRLTRGWDDRALYSLNTHLSETLGAQLVTMADIAHGWPGDERYGTFDSWVADLRTHGRALLAYAEAERSESFKDTRLAAQAAIRWVAVWLPSLWD